jgi:hypothetical protein
MAEYRDKFTNIKLLLESKSDGIFILFTNVHMHSSCLEIQKVMRVLLKRSVLSYCFVLESKGR